MVTYTMPVTGVVLGVSFLAEPLDVRVLLGTLLVVAGVVLVNRKSVVRRRIPRAVQTGLVVDPEPLVLEGLELAVTEDSPSGRAVS
jgi:hypothetical protein